MKRSVPILAALALVIVGGIVHGLWSERWETAAEFQHTVAQLPELSDDIPGWKAEPLPMEPGDLAMAGADASWSRIFTNVKDGTKLNVILLTGRVGRIAVHRPEHCYRGAGFDLMGSATRIDVKYDSTLAPFWTARFRKQDVAGAINLRIFWSWFGANHWEAPDSPRWNFARSPVLTKLYVVHELSTGQEPADSDPAIAFLDAALPRWSAKLAYATDGN